MSKPKSTIIADLIEFVTDQSDVAEILAERDNHPDAYCRQVRCRLVGTSPNDSTVLRYEIQFIYTVRHDDLESNDDVTVRVEYQSGASPSFNIRNVVKW